MKESSDSSSLIFFFFFLLGVPRIDQNFEQPTAAGDTELSSAENIWGMYIWVFKKIEKICLSQSWSRDLY